MSLVLTSGTSRPSIVEVFDLTETPPPSPPPLGHIANGSRNTIGQPLLEAQRQQHDRGSAQGEEPPFKKRRVDLSWAEKQTIACQQVSPYVSRGLADLSSSEYIIDEIAIRAVSIFAKDPVFISRLDDNDYALPANDEWTAVKAKTIVTDLSRRPEFQVPAVKKPAAAEYQFPSVEGPPSKQRQVVPEVHMPDVQQLETPRTDIFENVTPTAHWSRWKLPPKCGPSSNAWFALEQRPYQTASDRDLIAKGARSLYRDLQREMNRPMVYHVDFASDEIRQIIECISRYLPPYAPATPENLAQLCLQFNVPSIVGTTLPYRTAEDIRNYCSDLLANKATPPDKAQILTLDPNARDSQQQQERRRASRLTTLLLAREIEGNRGFGSMRQYENFQNEFKKIHEDSITLVAEYTNCAGDIATTTWIPDGNILCGTTVHSDSHNQQYNKPGNLLLCSTKLGQLKAFPDHRIPRPLVEKGENSTAAMRQSQDPWLYSSVVCSDYDHVLGLAYTSSFDKTVKVWKVDSTGSNMTALATWHFEGNVNFVAAAKDGSGRVATAADVPTQAIRIYTVNVNDIANSSYISFSCTRTDADDSGKWAYYPATMQWGRCRKSKHLLAVGYSPRSFSGEDHDIPEDKRNSGEITLWNAALNQRITVLTATTANFFEVVWHPTAPRFIAATSPSHLKVVPGVRTQIHLFTEQDGAYAEYHNLDCFAADINELTFMPNSAMHAYVTAACTDGKVYVWDTAQGDNPVHILQHGRPLDEYYEDREKEDTGVKFTAWGNNLDRFYSGASDGTVKVWNVRNRSNPYLRTILEAPGPISCGAFSPDQRKLVIGDATGRVFLFSIDKEDEPEAHFITIPGVDRLLRRPTPFKPHPDPEPPVRNPGGPEGVYDDEDIHIADLVKHSYLDTGQIVINPNPTIGAVQGPAYAATGLFRREAHLNEDPAGHLLSYYERNQRQSIDASRGGFARAVRRLKDPGEADATMQSQHHINKMRELDVEAISAEDLADLLACKAELTMSEADCGFVYEELPEEQEDASG
ncbi:quinon protein alcohol dehydrogenase-like superfamily [Trichoderma austrokoningii]